MTTRVENRPTLERLKSVRRREVSLPGEEVVRDRPLYDHTPLPLLIEPAAADLDLVGWAAARRDLLAERLLAHGGLLFRGFDRTSVEEFYRFAATVCDQLVNYVEGSSQRVGVRDKVYTSTEYPPELFVSLHNELSYAHRWPQKILFYCASPPKRGGETPIADSRRVFDLVPPAVRERFASRGVRYLRNLHGGRGAGLSWQQVFETDDRAVVEEYCRRGGIDFRWRSDGGLSTSQVRPAIVRHPKTGEPLWFNQVHQFHPSNLGEKEAAALLATTREEDLPIHGAFGDGSPLDREALAAVRDAYDQAMVTFPWQQGDLLLLDNMRVAHGRMPFSGPRKILVAMGDPVGHEELGEGQPEGDHDQAGGGRPREEPVSPCFD